MSDELPPLPPELASLRDVAPPPLPPGFEDRVAARLVVSLATIPMPSAPAGGAAAQAATSSGLVVSAGKLAGGAALVLLTGVGLGVGLDRVVLQQPSPPPPPPVVAQVAPPPPAPVMPEPVAPRPPPPVAVAPVVTPAPVAKEPAPPAGTRDVSLSAERALLEVARAALAKGDLPATFAAIERHEREFSKGRLVEEREALAIEALHAAGREAEAKARTERFVKQFPDSLLTP